MNASLSKKVDKNPFYMYSVQVSGHARFIYACSSRLYEARFYNFKFLGNVKGDSQHRYYRSRRPW